MKLKLIWLSLLTVLTIGLSILLYFLYTKPIGVFENNIKDTMFVFRGEAKKDDRILIVDVDETSLKALGQWPWSRNILAKIIDNLSDANVSVIGIDMIFTEKDKSSPNSIVKKFKLNTKEKLPDYDKILADSLEKSNRVVTAVYFEFVNKNLKSDGEVLLQAQIIDRFKTKSNIPKAFTPVVSIETINESVYSNGFINYNPKLDKVVRDVPSIISYDDILYPSISLEIARIFLKSKSIKINYNGEGIEHVDIKDTQIPTDLKGNIVINYTGKHPAYTYISASDIYNGKFDKKLFENSIVLIGTSAPGLYDIRSSPFDSIMPGVEAHAHLIDNIINKNFIAKKQDNITFDVLALILIPILCLFILAFTENISLSIAMGFMFIGLILVSHYILMFSYGLIFHTTILLLEIIFMYFFGNVIIYIFEHKQKEFIKAKFANKVSREVMEDIVKGGNDISLKGDTKEISIFFSDIRGFTTISESMESPQTLINYLNSYMTPMTDIITKNKGTVDKFIGDAIMAYWNAPRELKNHADYALKSAIEQIEKLKSLNEDFKKQNLPLINIGIGLNTGISIVGEMGSKGRSDYTCVGDCVNLASRLESLNKKYNTNIIISEFFLAKLSNPEKYNIKKLGTEQVKGKSKSVTIYTCYGYAK